MQFNHMSNFNSIYLAANRKDNKCYWSVKENTYCSNLYRSDVNISNGSNFFGENRTKNTK